MSDTAASASPTHLAGPGGKEHDLEPDGLTPPIAARRPVERVHHGHVFVDDYEWLRDKENPEVLAHLTAENDYTAGRTAHLEPLRQQLFDEISGRTKQTDLSVPSRRGGFWYYTRTVEGEQYALHCRVPATGDTPPDTASGSVADEQIMLDGNALADGSEFFSLGTVDVSPDGRLLAYSVDLTGAERFTIRILDLVTGDALADEIPGAFYSSAWSLDGSALFYVTVDDAWRPDTVWRHVLGTPAGSDQIVHRETDERFWLGIGLTRNQRAIQISASSKLTSEVWLLDAADPLGAPSLVAARREGVEYDVEHAGDHLLIVHNADAEDFSLSRAGLPGSEDTTWHTVIAGSPGRRLLAVDAFADHVVLYERSDGLTRLSVLRPQASGYGVPVPLEFDEVIYDVAPGSNPEWQSSYFRFSFTSMVTPHTVYDYDVVTGARILRKQQEVLGGVNLDDYVQYREWATAEDGTRVPLSVVARRDVTRDGTAPVVLYGYGSYEISIDPYFSIARLSLLERGVVYVIAHVRGGGEMGRHWYDQGKLLNKRTTFTDFIAAARHLVSTGWTTPTRIVAQGGSAGGLLMGAVANLAPEAFGGIVAQVPFVDALTTILDPSLPLTVTEWEEWGNPLDDAAVYDYMRSYSPYENVSAGLSYPPILAITSLNDTRVYFVEPAKWVAKLREVSETAATQVVLKTELDAGHGGRSGRYDAWRETAFLMAWQLDVLGLA